MKILSSLIVAACLYSSANAYFLEHRNYQNDLNILGSLDIESNYLKDKHFVNIKNTESKSFKKHLMRAVNEQYESIVLLQDELKKQRVPKEILYLAVVESGLKNTSKSGKGAAGIWQLMPSTAKALGLRVDKAVDERMDPVASTRAAAKYLLKLKDQFGKWYLALLAYNCGDGALKKAIAKAGSDDLKVLLDPEKKYLGAETRNFLQKIVLTAQIASDLDNIFSHDMKIFNNPNDAKLANINMKNFTLASKVEQRKNVQNYKVKKGESLLSIARKFDVPLRDLMRANDKKKPQALVGENLVIPR